MIKEICFTYITKTKMIDGVTKFSLLYYTNKTKFIFRYIYLHFLFNFFISSKSLSLWQLSNGFAFIQMIYSRDDELIDCEYVRQKNVVGDFLQKFYDEIAQARSRNFTSLPNAHHIKPLVTDREFRRFTEDNIMPDDYFEPAEDAFGMRNLSYAQLHKESDLPDDLKPLMNYKNLKMQCDEKHRQMQRIVHDMNGDSEERRTIAEEHLNR